MYSSFLVANESPDRPNLLAQSFLRNNSFGKDGFLLKFPSFFLCKIQQSSAKDKKALHSAKSCKLKKESSKIEHIVCAKECKNITLGGGGAPEKKSFVFEVLECCCTFLFIYLLLNISLTVMNHLKMSHTASQKTQNFLRQVSTAPKMGHVYRIIKLGDAGNVQPSLNFANPG